MPSHGHTPDCHLSFGQPRHLGTAMRATVTPRYRHTAGAEHRRFTSPHAGSHSQSQTHNSYLSSTLGSPRPHSTRILSHTYIHPLPVTPQFTHIWTHTQTPLGHTQSQHKDTRFPSTREQQAPGAHPCQSFTRESRPLPHYRGAGNGWGDL